MRRAGRTYNATKWPPGCISTRCLLLLLWACAGPALAQSEMGSAEDQVESAFATALVLTDSEVVTFGILSFDPDLIQLEDDRFGSEASVARRGSVKTYTFPAEWQLSYSGERLTPHIKMRLSYLDAEQDVVVGSDGSSENSSQNSSQNKDRVFGGYLESGFSFQITNKWEFVAGAGLHLMHYENNVSSTDPFSDVAESTVEGIRFDTSATALIGELQPRIIYSDEFNGVPWRFQSTYSYYAGETIRTADDLSAVKPKTWSWANDVIVRWGLPDVFDTSNQLRLLVRRIDVGGDVTGSLGTDSYYEFGLGWLFETSGISWLDNIGLSASLHTGSALSGGSLVLLYNEEW